MKINPLSLHWPVALLSLLISLLATPSALSAETKVQSIITFASENDRTLSVFTMQPDGQGREELVPYTVKGRGEYHPHVSPDGRWLSYTTYRYGGWKLAISRRDGSQVRRLTPTSHYAYDGDFSPDGEWLIYRRVETKRAPWFDGNLEIFAIRTDGTDEKNLTRSPSHDENPSFSADGKKIVYQSFLEDKENYEIFTMLQDGSGQKNLTRSAENEVAPSFSSDGKWIAFQRELNGRLELFVMASDGTAVRQLRAASSVAAREDNKAVQAWKFNTDFSPDGKQIVFTGMVDGDLELFTVHLDDTHLKRLTRHTGDDIHPVWTAE